jgi:hypothetical protein
MDDHIEKFYEFLIGDGSSCFREFLVQNWAWYTHATSLSKISEIRAHGLRPKNPGNCRTPEAIQNHGNKILCVAPNNDKIEHWVRSTSKQFPKIIIAVQSTDLPEKLCVDWSFPDKTNKLIDIEISDPLKNAMKIVSETLSVACYEMITSEKLVVYTKNAKRNDIATWAPLMKTSCDEIFLFLDPNPEDPDDGAYGLSKL